VSYGPFAGMCKEQITVECWAGRDRYDAATYGAPTTYPASVQIGPKLIAGSAGREVFAEGRVYVLTSCTFDVKDKITLPAWCGDTQPPIVGVEPERDGNRTRFCVIYFGRRLR
jgi:hypothetical protein